MELGEQLRFDTLTRLVSGPEIIPKRFDHMVGGDADVCAVALQHPEYGAEDAHDRGHLVAVAVGLPRHRVEMPEQLVGAVKEKDLHNQISESIGRCEKNLTATRRQKPAPGSSLAPPV